MLFSYCKRSNSEEYAHVPYRYIMSPLHTARGFGKTPAVCNNLNVPYVANRGIPVQLIDKEGELRGQGRVNQPFCATSRVPGEIQFSMLDWLKDVPVPNKSPIPCVPTTSVQMSPKGGSLCSHINLKTRCGDSCACGPGCQCRIQGLERNMARPHVGPVGFNAEPACTIRF